jgi:putative SOS response-associated peptidase YedK
MERTTGRLVRLRLVRAPAKPFGFAGLWEHWQGGEEIFSCALITTQANDVLRPYHYRMPVIIPASSYTAAAREPPHRC